MSNVGKCSPVDFLGTALKFRKREKNSYSLVLYTSAVHKTWNKASHCSRVVTAKKCKDKCDAPAELLFC